MTAARDATHDRPALELVARSGLPLRYLALSRNFGKEAALSAGIDHARGNAVVLIDADFQHPLELLPQMQRPVAARLRHGLWRDRRSRRPKAGPSVWARSLFYRIMNAGNTVKIAAQCRATSAGWIRPWSMPSSACPSATAS